MERAVSTTPGPVLERCTLLHIDEAHRPYLAAAILRFSALNPLVSVEQSEQITLLDDGSAPIATLVADFRHCLYREKIYAETLSLRLALITGVLGR